MLWREVYWWWLMFKLFRSVQIWLVRPGVCVFVWAPLTLRKKEVFHDTSDTPRELVLFFVRVQCSAVYHVRFITNWIVCASDVGSERNQFSRLFLLTDIDCLPLFDLFRYFCFIPLARTMFYTFVIVDWDENTQHKKCNCRRNAASKFGFDDVFG